VFITSEHSCQGQSMFLFRFGPLVPFCVCHMFILACSSLILEACSHFTASPILWTESYLTNKPVDSAW